ncbi:MAG: hypothetical protein KF729_14725 [Sandaracinaceae bacterium]|nr:hypothetical protein [Sandaracinaceae bacterium]
MRSLLVLAAAPLLVSAAPSGPDRSVLPPTTPLCEAPAPTTSGAALGTPAPAQGESLMDPRFGGGLGFFEVDGAAVGPRTTSTAPIELELTGPARRRADEPLGLALGFVNRSASAAVVMRALDGSLEHWREPHYDIHLRDEATGRVYRWDYHGGRCGNVNPVRDEDYVTLAPGERRDDVAGGWSGLRGAAVGAPGRYAVWVVYRYCGGPAQGIPLGPNAQRPDVTRGVFASNAITIEVR